MEDAREVIAALERGAPKVKTGITAVAGESRRQGWPRGTEKLWYSARIRI
jgi:hypothetical protein